jgi:protein TonB
VSTQNPPPPAPIIKPVTRARNYLVWGFALSILIHMIAAPLVSTLRYHETQQPDVTKVSISKKVKIVVPTPPPPTPPPPTPPPQTPPPQKSTPPPPQPRQLKLNIPKTHAVANSGAEKQYVAPPNGSENGVPNAVGTSSAAPSTAAPPEPSAPPKPACAQPNVEPTPKSLVQPDYPEIAREQGASGTAKVQVTLDAQGNVLSASINQSSGSPVLDKAALEAAKASTFFPQITDCAAVGGTYVVSEQFDSQ